MPEPFFRTMRPLFFSHTGSEAEIAAAIVLLVSIAITIAWIWHVSR